MSSRLYEVYTGMNTIVHNVYSVYLILRVEICIVSLLNIFNDGPPWFGVIDKIAETGCIDNSKAEADTILFDVGTNWLYRNGFRYDLVAWTLLSFWGIERRVEESIDKRRFPKPGFALTS